MGWLPPAPGIYLQDNRPPRREQGPLRDTPPSGVVAPHPGGVPGGGPPAEGNGAPSRSAPVAGEDEAGPPGLRAARRPATRDLPHLWQVGRQPALGAAQPLLGLAALPGRGQQRLALLPHLVGV